MSAGILTREDLISAVAAGFTQTEIADSLGVTPSAVHQAIEKYQVMAAAAERKANSRAATIDDRLDKIEELATAKLELAVAHLSDPLKILRVLDVVNKAKRRSLGEHKTGDSVTNIAVLQLPQRMAIQVVQNQQNEVVEIDGRPLVTMQAAVLLQKIREKQATLPAPGGENGLDGKSISEML